MPQLRVTARFYVILVGQFILVRMKEMKIRHLLLILTVLFSNAILGQYDIKVVVDGLTCKDELKLASYRGARQYYEQSSVCENGVFRIKGDESLKTGNYIILLPNNNFFDFLVSSNEDQTQYSFKLDTNLYLDEMIVSGSRENELFFDFRSFEAIQKSKIQQENRIVESSKDTLKRQLSLNKISELEKSIEENRKETIAKAGNLFVGKFLNAHRQVPMIEAPENMSGENARIFKYNWIRNHYFDNIDLKEDGLLRTPIYQKEVSRYFDKYLPRNVDSSINVVNEFMTRLKNEGSKAQYQFCLSFLINRFQTSKRMCFDKIAWHLAKNYYCAGKAAIDETRRLQACEFADIQSNTLCGQRAHDMNMLDTSFVNRVRLHDIDKACTILVFWDIDCSHCKMELPIIQSIFDTLNQDELEIYAVYINGDFVRWREQLRKTGYTFTNVADVNADSDFREVYKVVSTPKLYVLDRDKNIVFKDISVTDIPSILNYMIGQENKED